MTKGIVMPIASLAEGLIPDVIDCGEDGEVPVGEGMAGETLVSEGRVGLVPGVILLVVLIPRVGVWAEVRS
jgi:hypothetical protein